VRIPGWGKGISGKTSSFIRGNIFPAGRSLGGDILAGSRERYWDFFTVYGAMKNCGRFRLAYAS
jgi:hypothetical protein